MSRRVPWNAFAAWIVVLIASWPASAGAQELVPAGTINDALGREPVYLVDRNPLVGNYAEQVRKRIRPRSRTLGDAEAAGADLAGKDLVVYATPEHAWIERHAARLPFRWSEGAVEIDGRKFTGERLRLICAVKNPQDPERRAVIYAAARPEDLVDINAVFHGPTEWLVADGERTLAAASFTGVLLTVEALRADLDYLAAAIRDVHPATAGGMPPELAKAIEAARGALREPLTRMAAWRVFARVLLPLRDAHSAMAPPVSGERLALPLAWLDAGLAVGEDAGDLRRGDRIVAIGGNDGARLLAALEEVVPAENPHWVRARGEALLADAGLLRALALAGQAPVPVRIERGGKVLEVLVEVAAAARGAPSAQPWVRYTLDKEHDLGLFTLDRCAVDALYRETLKKFFTAVHEQGIRRVAVDLRANGGGNSQVTEEFLRYLDVEGYLSFGGEMRWSEAAAKQRGLSGMMLKRTEPARRRNARHDEPPPFQGRLFVVTGKQTFSSGNWFAAVVQDNKLGLVLGEPTGNSPSSYGDLLNFSLPHSALSFTLSHKRWIRPDPSRDPAPALLPNVALSRTPEQVRDGIDPVLEFLRSSAARGDG